MAYSNSSACRGASAAALDPVKTSSTAAASHRETFEKIPAVMHPPTAIG